MNDASTKSPALILIDVQKAFMMVDEQRTVGTCALVKLDYNRYQLAKMAVAPASRGQGIGSLLMSAIVAKAELMYAEELTLQTNSRLTNALRLYEKNGFERAPDAVLTEPSRGPISRLIRKLRYQTGKQGK